MNNIFNTPSNLHQMTLDATTFLSHMGPVAWLLSLVVASGIVYLINREKTALCIAVSGGIYLLPFLITGHMF